MKSIQNKNGNTQKKELLNYKDSKKVYLDSNKNLDLKENTNFDTNRESNKNVKTNHKTADIVKKEREKSALVNDNYSKVKDGDLSPANKRTKVLEDKVGKEFFIPVIFTNSGGFEDNQSTYNFLNELGKLMKQYPQLKVEIVGNSFKKGGEGVNIINSVAFARNFADSLKLRMINSRRIIVRGVGKSFPVVNPNISIVSKNVISKFNNRLDIYMHNYKELPIKIKRQPIIISQKIRDDRYQLYRSNLIGLSYKILVKTGDFLFHDELLAEYPDSWIETDDEHNKYYYTVGLYQKYKKAKAVYKDIAKKRSGEIKVIPYIDGLRITPKEALTYAKTYPDLVNYLENNK